MLARRQILFLCLIVTIHASSVKRAPSVTTRKGKLIGYYKISGDGRQYEAYEGIPYALPPVGNLRFSPPQRPSWNRTLLATSFGNECLQFVGFKNAAGFKGSEDCLYLNVYVPIRKETNIITLMPVIFWIHDGTFQYGSGIQTDVKYLMDRDVIVVTFNYRLGPFGFLSMENEEIPGNMGLKDQSMALRWVSENIEIFGGNPKKITLIGLEAGGASVHYHYLSPWSAGLFQGGISIGGTAFNNWAQTKNAIQTAKTFIEFVGCSNSIIILHCLKHRQLYEFEGPISEYFVYVKRIFSFAPFGPVIEKFGNKSFIDRTPIEIVSSGNVQDVPWITAVVSEESLYPVAEFINDSSVMKHLDKNWDLLAPYFLDYNNTISKQIHIKVARLARKYYLGTKSINRQNAKEFVQMVGDRFFVVDSEKAARLQAKVNLKPVWYYYFSYRGTHSFSDALNSIIDNYGNSHGDDAFYLVNNRWINPRTQEDREMQRILIDFWVSFATDGVPKIANVEWPRLDPSKNEFHYLHIASPTNIYMDSNANFGDKNFWNLINFIENKLTHKSVIEKEEL